MYTRGIRAVVRIFFHALRVLLGPIEAVHPRAYMRVYTAMLRACGMKFTGYPRYISSAARFDKFSLITLGARTVISRNVIFLTHDYSLTAALIAIGEAPPTDMAMHQEIRVGSNVFIGMNAILLPGTMIGDNVIIAAGSVARGDLSGNAVYAGNPIKRISGITDRADEWRARRDSNLVASDTV